MRFPKKDKTQWNPWFAWRPVCVESFGARGIRVYTYVWLEKIEKKKIIGLYSDWYVYRFRGPTTK